MKHSQDLSIAYDMKRKNRKKKASGGSVQSGSPDMNYAEGGSVSASNERRPMPDNLYDDKLMANQNRGNKPPKNDHATDNPTIKQAQANDSRKVMKIKHPKMVPQNLYSVRLRDEEDDLEQSASPGPYGAQPPEHDDEMDAKKSGDKVPDMADEHSTHKKPYKQEIEDQYAQDMAEADMKRRNSYAKGGMIDDMHHASRHDMEPADHDIQERERMDERHLMSMEDPSEDEGYMDARSRNEMGPDRQGPKVPDMEDEHSTNRKPYAGGGKIGDSEDNIDHEMELNPAHGKYSADDSEDQPKDEEMEEHHNSIAAAIMAKKDRSASKMSNSDMDEMLRLYEGGEIMEHARKINSHDSIYSDDSDMADLSRNADEDANEEDQLSFNSLGKENYSESEGLKQLDSPMDSAQHSDDEEMDSHDRHDKVGRIMRKMKSQRQF